MRSRTTLVMTALALAALFLPRIAWACATCYGDPEAPMTQGLNAAILFLVGVIGLVQVGIVKVVWDIRKRSKKVAPPTELRFVRGGK